MEDSGSLLLVASSDDLGTELERSLPTGWTVTRARDARAAREVIHRRSPTVAVVAIRSGSAGGFATARELAQLASARSVPILMLLERAQDAWLAEQAGARATILLPADPADIAASAVSLAGDPAPA